MRLDMNCTAGGRMFEQRVSQKIDVPIVVSGRIEFRRGELVTGIYRKDFDSKACQSSAQKPWERSGWSQICRRSEYDYFWIYVESKGVSYSIISLHYEKA